MKTHRPSFYLAIYFSLGILAAALLPIGLLPACCVLAVCLLCAAFKLPGARVFIVLSFVMLGFIYTKSYGHLSGDDIGRVSWKKSKAVIQIDGVIDSEVETRKLFKGVKTSFELAVDTVHTHNGQQRKSGRVLVNIFHQENLSYGDRLRLTGKLHRPFKSQGREHFSYADYLKRKGIYWIFSVGKSGAIELLENNRGNFILARGMALRGRLMAVLKEYLTPIEAAVMQSFLLGGRSAIPEEIRDLFELGR